MDWIREWGLLIGYIAVVLISSVWMARQFLIGHERSYPNLSIDSGDRVMFLVLGLMVSVVWPVTVPLYVIFRALGRSRLLLTPGEVARQRVDREREELFQARIELARYRKLAEQHDLPIVEIPEAGQR